MSPQKHKRNKYWQASDQAKRQRLLWLLVKADQPLSYSQLRKLAKDMRFSNQTFDVYFQDLKKSGQVREIKLSGLTRPRYVANKQDDEVKKFSGAAFFSAFGMNQWLSEFENETQDLTHQLRSEPDTSERLPVMIALEDAFRKYILLHLDILHYSISVPMFRSIATEYLQRATGSLLDFISAVRETESSARVTDAISELWGIHIFPSKTLPYFVGKMWRHDPTPRFSMERTAKQQLAIAFGLELSQALVELHKERKLTTSDFVVIHSKLPDIFKHWLLEKARMKGATINAGRTEFRTADSCQAD